MHIENCSSIFILLHAPPSPQNRKEGKNKKTKLPITKRKFDRDLETNMNLQYKEPKLTQSKFCWHVIDH